MAKQNQVMANSSSIGIAPVGIQKERACVEHRIDSNLGTVILTETRSLAHGPGAQEKNTELLAEVAASAAEVLSSHLSSYLSSSDQEGKVIAADPSFLDFIRQSIVGTDPILMDTALHAQVMSVGGGRRNIAKLSGNEGKDHGFSAVGLNDSLPAISCNLEVAVLYPQGVHIAHRGQSRQYLVNGKRVKQITRDYNVGGLLSSLDSMGDFLPKVELKSIKLTARDRLVIFSQGCFPKGHKVDLPKLVGERTDSPQRHALAIARRVGEYKLDGGGYVIVMDPLPKPNSRLGFKNSGHLGATPPKPEKSKSKKTGKDVPPAPKKRQKNKTILGVAAVKPPVPKPPPPKPLVTNKQKSSSIDDLENSKLFSPAELFDLRGRMKDRFEDELGSFEEEMYEILEAKMEAMGKRLAQKFASVEASAEKAADLPVMTVEPPPPTGVPEDAGWDFDSLTNEVDPQSQLPEELEAAPLTESKTLALKQFTSRLVGKTSQAIRHVGDQLAQIEVKGKRPFAKRWVLPVSLAILLLLIIVIVTASGSDQEETPKVPSVATGDVKPDSKKSLVETKKQETKKPSPVDTVAQEKTKAAPASADDSNHLEFILGAPDSRDHAYSSGRRLYLEGDAGRDSSGKRLIRDARLRKLLGALPYLTFARETDAKLEVNDPDLLFLEARTHYVLAKLGLDRKDHAKLALDAFNKYNKQVRRSPAKKKKTIARNMSKLRRWLK